ncbi:hypothetical protein [Aeromonas phage Riv-10]|uniref:Uncharacterized protein n=3 Tax=Biquartavirus TaxID=1912143 RepID=Q6U9J9_9CAUD|nr:hypothetical protein ST44RRORF103c [Aeromonas phage 44RR2.8t]APU00574.1 hypothetical protein [Aeromonas phage 44RR2.8t.2]APU02156.1 hypothetical protein [Aeromonas phage Riv-10]UYD59655.1 hypothetical protein JNMOADIG_00126 [Aeromonas phage avDM5]UYD60371.1 hypothetical protein NPHMPGLK_00036 [Aeromonas phage avDM2]AAQ81422.1 hypothetical protein 44RRORF103c [Aeromonas phage 44RR2.8t]
MAANKWQKPGPVMNRVFEEAFIGLLGDGCENIIVHSFKDDGDEVIVNFELVVGGKLIINQTRLIA